MPYIGIDFGTSNSVVANFQFGQAEVLPNHEGQQVDAVRRHRSAATARSPSARKPRKTSTSSGPSARSSASSALPNEFRSSARNCGTEQIAVMLFTLLKSDAEAVLKQPIQKAVVTIPANSKGLARHATKLCAGAPGCRCSRSSTSRRPPPSATDSIARTNQTVLVYDFGGGTLDVTILSVHHGIFEEVGSKGIGKLGGDDLDNALAIYLADRFQEKTGYDILGSPYRTAFLTAVERAKIDAVW